MLGLLCFAVGIIISLLAVEAKLKYGWSTLRTLIVIVLATFIFGTMAGALSVFADTNTPAMQKLRQSAVMVGGLSCTGSGSIVEGKSGKHYLLTNQHVCNCAKYNGYIYATFEGGELIKARVVKGSWGKDLCAAQAPDTYKALKLGIQAVPFMDVYSRGYPLGRLTESHGKIKGNVVWDLSFGIEELGECPLDTQPERGFNGNIVACRLRFTSTVTSLYSRPGSSGSAVVDSSGNIVGVVSSFIPIDEYDAGIVTFEQVRDFLSTL